MRSHIYFGNVEGAGRGFSVRELMRSFGSRCQPPFGHLSPGTGGSSAAQGAVGFGVTGHSDRDTCGWPEYLEGVCLQSYTP